MWDCFILALRDKTLARRLSRSPSSRWTMPIYVLASTRIPRAQVTGSLSISPTLSPGLFLQKHVQKCPRDDSAPGSSPVIGRARALAHTEFAPTRLFYTVAAQLILVRNARHRTSHAATASERALSANSESPSVLYKLHGHGTPVGKALSRFR